MRLNWGFKVCYRVSYWSVFVFYISLINVLCLCFQSVWLYWKTDTRPDYTESYICCYAWILVSDPFFVFFFSSLETLPHRPMVSGHFARRSIRPMTVRPDFLVRSFHSFSVKLDVKRAFFWLMVKERGILMSSPLVFARGLKTCEKFWLYCGTMWLWTI